MKRPDIYTLILLSIFAGFLLPNLFSTGIFGDGLIYAVVSRNLSEGQGSWWNLYYSAYIFSPFAEHPPLLFWIESLWFRLIGDHHFTEKSFSILLAVFMAFSLRFFWIRLAQNTTEKTNWWFPVLLWILVPTIHWAYPNNMLENLLVLFTSWAVWFGIYQPTYKKAFLVGVLIFFAFFTKGVVGLFPLAVFGLRWLVLKEEKWNQALAHTALALFAFCICLSFSLIPEAARTYWWRYLDIQLLATLKSERLVQDHVVNLPRYYLLTRLFTELFNPLALSAILLLATRQFSQLRQSFSPNRTEVWLFLAIAASATLPLLISPKQHSFYLIPAIPWFIFALTKAVGPSLFTSFSRWQPQRLSYKISYLLFSLLFVSALLISYTRANKAGRDKNLMAAVAKISARLSDAETIGIPASLVRHHSLHGYFQRNHHISLIPNDSAATFWISTSDSLAPGGFQKIELELAGYTLYNRQ